jgi:predicted transcriptional regulator
MAKKRRGTKSSDSIDDLSNIAAGSTISESSQALPSRPPREIKIAGLMIPPDIVNQLDEVAKAFIQKKALFALSYIRRREILQTLKGGSKGTTEIRNLLEKRLSAPNIKGHLDVLVSTGLVFVNQLTYDLTLVGKMAVDFMHEVKERWLDEFSTEEGSIKRFNILSYLYLREESKFDQIAEIIGINKSEVHRFLKSLVHAGLVKKGPARFDPYAITAEGRTFYNRLNTAIENLADLYAMIIAEDSEGHVSHKFLVSPKRGLVMIEYEDLLLEVKNKKFVRLD